MQFVVVPNTGRVPNEGQNVGYLWVDNWDDWFTYNTLYVLTYFDDAGEKHEIGGVKIGQFDMEKGQKRPNLPSNFKKLSDSFFSLGQDVDYYSSIMSLGPDVSNMLFSALNDIATNEELYKNALKENVAGVSLLRSVNMKTIEGQYRRILSGGVELTNFWFRYVGPKPRTKGLKPLDLEFQVTPDSRPPTNIHVLIGRNGVGKSFILNAMTRALVLKEKDEAGNGIFMSRDEWDEETGESPFSNILSISFSAFDDFEIIRQRRNATKGVRYINVGLRKRVKNKKDEIITITRAPKDLALEFSASAKLCSRGVKSERWKNALTTLEADPLFAEAEVSNLVNVQEDSFGREAGIIYRRLSSGHKIVLLTITKLVEHVEEKTLILMDEPEAHLHPPLLAAFVRSLSDLLINRNGVAIIATHSPVVLQEVPLSCAWKIIRHGLAAKASRLEIETFGENIGILTKEVFGHEVLRSGFHKMLSDAVKDEEDIKDVVEKFDYEVGSDGRALISSMIASKKRERDE